MLIDILSDGLSLETILRAVILLVVVIIAITVHEYAHARSAKSYGDDTAEQAGRITLNPKAHYDPVGSTLLLLFGFGWAKPVPVNPRLMRNPRLDALRVALWGPWSNVLMAIGAGMVVRFVPGIPDIAGAALRIFMLLNLYLAFFNLLPLPPLDGSRIITYLLPPDLANRYERFMFQYGSMLVILIILIVPRVLSGVVGGAASSVARVILGPSSF